MADLDLTSLFHFRNSTCTYKLSEEGWRVKKLFAPKVATTTFKENHISACNSFPDKIIRSVPDLTT